MPHATKTNEAQSKRPANVDTKSRQTTFVNRDQSMQPGPDLVDYLKDYAREKPEVAALWCLGIGFVLGWKLKPW